MKSTCLFYIKVAWDIPQNTRGKSPTFKHPLLLSITHRCHTGISWTTKIFSNLSPSGNLHPILVTGIGKKYIQRIFYEIHCTLHCSVMETNFHPHWNFTVEWCHQRLESSLEGGRFSESLPTRFNLQLVGRRRRTIQGLAITHTMTLLYICCIAIGYFQRSAAAVMKTSSKRQCSQKLSLAYRQYKWQVSSVPCGS